MTHPIPSERIGYTRDFLHSTGNDFERAQRRGVFLGMADGSDVLARVKWDDDNEESCVNINNICGVRSCEFSDRRYVHSKTI